MFIKKLISLITAACIMPPLYAIKSLEDLLIDLQETVQRIEQKLEPAKCPPCPQQVLAQPAVPEAPPVAPEAPAAPPIAPEAPAAPEAPSAPPAPPSFASASTPYRKPGSSGKTPAKKPEPKPTPGGVSVSSADISKGLSGLKKTERAQQPVKQPTQENPVEKARREMTERRNKQGRKG